MLGHSNFGLFLIDHGETVRGIEELQAAIRSAPNWGQPWYWWSLSARKLGFGPNALEGALKAARLDPGTDRYRYLAARELIMVKRYAEALPHLTALAQIAGPYSDAGYLAGYAHQMLGDLDAAEIGYSQQLARDPSNVLSLYNLGHVWLTRRRCDKARPLFEQALAVDPKSAGAKAGLARCPIDP